MYYDTTVGCYLSVKGVDIQKLDSVLGHSDSVMRCNLGLNFKVGKMNYRVGNLDPN